MKAPETRNKRIISFFLALALILSASPRFLLGEISASECKLNKEFLLRFSRDFKETLFSPRDWKKKDLLTFSAVLGTGALLYVLDGEIQEWVQDHRTSTSDDVSDVVRKFGEGLFLGGLIAALYTSGEITKNNSLRKTALLSLESWLTSGFIVHVFKFVTGRARPHTGESRNTFHPFSTKARYHSFPSGHSASAFAVATTIADQTEAVLVDILAYSLATSVALSRVHDNQHWFSDVFIGSAVGYFVAKKICALNLNQKPARLGFSFCFREDSKMISLSLYF